MGAPADIQPQTPAEIIGAYRRELACAGGRARAQALSPERRRKIAAKGGRARARQRRRANRQAPDA